jgi:hypothetical protein
LEGRLTSWVLLQKKNPILKGLRAIGKPFRGLVRRLSSVREKEPKDLDEGTDSAAGKPKGYFRRLSSISSGPSRTFDTVPESSTLVE